MTNISAAPSPTAAASAPAESSGAAGKAAPAEGSSGFLALIDALLQGSTLGSEAAAEPFAIPAEESTDDDPAGDADALELLAGMGFAAAMPAPLPPAAPEAAEGGTGMAGAKGLNAAALAAAAIELASGEGDADEALLEDEGTFAAVAGRTDETAAAGRSDSLTPPNAWASAANRIAAAQGAASAGDAHAGTLREPVGTGPWRDELGARLTLMATNGQQSGSLRLSPEHLGPLQIDITVNDDKTTNVQFGAQHADTRSALQDALPRLREMFSAAGLMLGDAGVSQQAPRDRPADEPVFRRSGTHPGDGEPTPVQRPVRRVTHSGLLDTYA